MFRDAWLICRKEVRVELRSKVTLTHVLPFVFAVAMLFAFALDGDSPQLRRATPGLFWVTTLFATTMITQRTSAIDRPDGLGDALRLSGLSPAGMFLGKTAALALQLLVTEFVLACTMVIMFDVRFKGIALLIAATPLATVAMAAAGALYGPLAAGLRGRESVLPLLILPILAPVLLGATRSFDVAFGTGVGAGWQWVALLGMLGGIYVVAGCATAAAVLEET